MRTLTRYLTSEFLTTCLVAVLFSTFAISIGFIFKLTDLIAQGVAWQPLARLFLLAMPTSIVQGLPLGALVSALLVFGRLSDDGEIVAMRASGLSMSAIAGPPLWIAGLLVGVSLLINHELEPRAHYARRTQQAALTGVSALQTLEEGRFIPTGNGLAVYVGSKSGPLLRDIRICDARELPVRSIRARRGLARESEDGQDLVLELQDVRIDRVSRELPAPGTFGTWSIDLAGFGRRVHYNRDHDDIPSGELVHQLRHMPEAFPRLDEDALNVQRRVIQYELSRRSAMAFACLALVIVGVPIGVRSHRKSSTLSVLLSLVLFFLYYALTLMAQSLAKLPHARADLVIWLPVVAFVIAGTLLIRRQG